MSHCLGLLPSGHACLCFTVTPHLCTLSTSRMTNAWLCLRRRTGRYGCGLPERCKVSAHLFHYHPHSPKHGVLGILVITGLYYHRALVITLLLLCETVRTVLPGLNRLHCLVWASVYSNKVPAGLFLGSQQDSSMNFSSWCVHHTMMPCSPRQPAFSDMQLHGSYASSSGGSK